MTAHEHLVEVLQGVGVALRAIGMDADAAQVESLVGSGDTEATFDLLDDLGPRLVRKYLRANDFIGRAAPGIRQDAMEFTRNCFAARCWVSVARQAAKRVLQGEALVLN